MQKYKFINFFSIMPLHFCFVSQLQMRSFIDKYSAILFCIKTCLPIWRKVYEKINIRGNISNLSNKQKYVKYKSTELSKFNNGKQGAETLKC